MATNNHTGNLLPKQTKLGGRGTIKASDFFAAQHQTADAAIADMRDNKGEQTAEKIIESLKAKMAEAGISEDSPEYAAFAGDVAEGAEREYLDAHKHGNAADLRVVQTVVRRLEQFARDTRVNQAVKAKKNPPPSTAPTANAPVESVPAPTTPSVPSTSTTEASIPADQTQNVGPILSQIRSEHRMGPQPRPAETPQQVGEAMTKIRQEIRHGGTKAAPAIEEKNLKERGRLIDLEEKQRKLFAANMKDMGVKSKLMFEHGNRTLEQLNKLSEREEENISRMSDGSKKILEQIRDLLKAARGAGSDELGQIMKKLEYLHQYGQEQAEAQGDSAGQRVLGQAYQTARGMGKAPQPGLLGKLGSHYGNQLKDTARSIYEQAVPAGVRIIAEHVGSKLFNSNSKQERAAGVEGRIQAMQDVLDKRRDEEDYDSPRGRKRKTGLRLVGGLDSQRKASDALGGAGRISPQDEDLHLKSITVDKLVVNGDDKKDDKLAQEFDKHNLGKAKGGKGDSGKGLFGSLFETISGFGSKLAGLLPLLGTFGLAIAALGAAAYSAKKLWDAFQFNKDAQKHLEDVKGQQKGVDETTAQVFKRVNADRVSKGLPAFETEEQMLKFAKDSPNSPVSPAAKTSMAGVTPAAASSASVGASSSSNLDQLTPEARAYIEQDQKWRAANGGKIMPPSRVSPPAAAIDARTSMVDSVTRTNETMKDVRGAKPNIVVNNVGGGGKQGGSHDNLPIGMGAARNQENAFSRYLLSTFAPL